MCICYYNRFRYVLHCVPGCLKSRLWNDILWNVFNSLTFHALRLQAVQVVVFVTHDTGVILLIGMLVYVLTSISVHTRWIRGTWYLSIIFSLNFHLVWVASSGVMKIEPRIKNQVPVHQKKKKKANHFTHVSSTKRWLRRLQVISRTVLIFNAPQLQNS